ncbi:E3 ubiquitin-protein ligase SSM4 [Aspergillus neoniger CBS 115656]|uniref:RING-type E3 ubiquitin transferase n=1 Tax=Aspergillus neoniger (strain CBS 115656) TaxID=1448310 RepID=A0A318YDB7_ASPNB|nr:RING finger membrane protein [Aspergillus neoniger CBS 115656]PYH32425.1 RING finger membrane protein [Aspergillus neoniger CBS 115656]
MEFPEGSSRDYTHSTSFPDLMNDPAYQTNYKGKEREFEEPDTCRICRGEGTEEEQLFYPCKCSGSIKFVHQACLVEWLSHSQKKHCELCKTPFRFTKLYDPNMPQNLPAPLFLRQLLIHSFRTIVTWLRFVLVAFVWLGWLPWSMRAIWRALFWLADGRWSGADAPQQSSSEHLAQLVANGTASMNVGAATTALAGASDVPAVQSPVSSMFSFSSGEPLLLTVIKKAFSALFFPAMSGTGSLSTSPSNVTAGSYKPRRPSWLSDVEFLNTLTPSPTINNILIDTLEGQLITLLVVISFILVFLIREWVVQQQPMANIAEGEREAAVQLIANNRPVQRPEEVQPELHAPQPEDVPRDESTHEHVEDISNRADEGGLGSLAETESYRVHSSFRDGNSSSSSDSGTQGPSTSQHMFRRNSDSEDELNPLSLEHSTSHGNQVWPGVDTFRDLWARGHGDPEQVLRLVREEGRQDELGWIVTAMTKLQRNDSLRGSWRRESPLHEAASSDSFPDQTEMQSESSSARSPLLEPSSSAVNRHPWDIASVSNPLGTGASDDRQDREFTNDDLGSSLRAVGDSEVPSDSTPSADTGIQSDQVPSASASTNAVTTNAERASENAVATPQNDQAAAASPKNLVARLFDWFWADLETPDQGQDRPQEDDDHVVEDPALEAPFVPIQNNRRLANEAAPNNQAIAPDLGLDANDAEAVEEGDDLEGILELIGMQGPIFGLLQNGVFSALLISFTVAIGIWLPYLWGKIALVLLANPVQLVFGVPMTAISVFADVTLDTLIGSLGYVMYWLSLTCKVVLSPFGAFVPLGEWIPQTKSVTSASLSLIDASSHRLRNVLQAFFVFHESDVPMFSVLSHQALKIHQARIAAFTHTAFTVGKFILHDFPLRIVSHGPVGAFSVENGFDGLAQLLVQARDQVDDLVHQLLYTSKGTSWFGSSVSGSASAGITISYDLAVWDTKDRVIAIFMGYLLASALGLLYLRFTNMLSGGERGQRVEGIVADILHQAGGVMKVILIIGIEMIVFPLYCGSLLDVALLPLFENATIASRLEFTSSSPLTSLFVHWFIGTCYMFHFALFVSMCRKIMRSGVLYFIRDPDDPTFHPVRDVLERNITTQLRKIAFSALVYGALVIVCLGGVVWGIYYAFDDVLPVHWSATIPVLEFPVDLLFYNFVMPLAIQSIKPSDGLHNLYDWWFHKCARFLRLTNFFFGERQVDEEGYHARRTWWDVLSAAKGDPEHPVVDGHPQNDDSEKPSVYFARDGRFVRAPASDQVRIPKGSQVFLEVTESNQRVDGAPDTDQGLHGRANDMFTKVYIPPRFRTRIAAFILLIWVFAAATGVGITVVPLIIGRKVMSSTFPHRPLNDVYAFSTGTSIVGTAAYILYYSRPFLTAAKDRLSPYLQSPREACVGVMHIVLDAARITYVLATFAVLLPSLVALVMELYLLVPAHTYVGGAQAHVIHFIQDWTLGVLYVQMAVKFVLWNAASRPAAALNAIVRDGMLKPNAKVTTRAVLLPVMLLATLAVVVPLILGFSMNATVFSSTPEVQSKVYRYAYPATLVISLMGWLVYLVRRQVEIWRVNIRDDVYLIGERLHNFREKRARDVGVPRRVITG